MGMFINTYPVILGNDLAGEVVEISQGVTAGFHTGQRILAHALSLKTSENKHAEFQRYVIVDVRAACPIPEGMEYRDACVIPLAVSTVAESLYQSEHLGLPLPSHNPRKIGKNILIWGGSSSVGSSAIQLVVASGLDVVTTASAKNFEYCKKLGAKAVFDCGSPTVFADLKAELEKEDVVGALDAIGNPDTTLKITEVLAQQGNQIITTVKPPPPHPPVGVTVTRVYGSFVPSTEAGKTIYKDFLPAALESGQFKPAPDAEIIGKGLDNLQKGLDRLNRGGSAKKIVVLL
ncbi:hypothetical protein G7Y89_g1938 [Cudoniella acicularis]|uniref:Enoyl reductase (ER) domain-containing protein n=1 Tax=Cudoniella acicularis TaxID=354080 RepID=A0A8H4RUC6_9HELO|nr:hypothetical protein G7Y89_g1938 [Cudoniella acicularis]